MIKMKLVEKKKIYVVHPSIGIVNEGDVIETYKKYHKGLEEMGFELLDDKEGEVKE